MDRRKTTLKDVSQKCGFSVNTVSRVMRDDPHISEQTKAIIRRTASELGYIKNNSASTMSSGHSNMIAIIINNVQNPHFSGMLYSMEKKLHQFGYDTMILCTQNDKQTGEERVQTAISRSVEGILYFPFHDDSRLIRYMEQNHIPYVLLDRWVKGITADTARCDDEMGGYLIGEHLAMLGHRRFLYLEGPEGNSSHGDRKMGFMRALKQYHIDPEAVRLIPLAEMDEAVASDSLYELLQPFDYTAVASFNDEMAYYAMNVLRKHQIRVPEDISLIGFDHLYGFFPYLPPLTSVAEYNGSVANTAVDCLIRRIREPESEKRISILPVQIFDEGTTAPPSLLFTP